MKSRTIALLVQSAKERSNAARSIHSLCAITGHNAKRQQAFHHNRAQRQAYMQAARDIKNLL